MKVGDLVTLKSDNDFPKLPGALTALKFYARMMKDYQGKVMLIIDIVNEDKAALILVDGYIHTLGINCLRVVSEARGHSQIKN